MKYSRQKGFIEVVVVLVMIAIFVYALIVIFNPLKQIQKDQNEKKKKDLASISLALENYYKVLGRYPKHSLQEPKYRILGLDGLVVDWGRPWEPYGALLPSDPTHNDYVYYSQGDAYWLYASLDGAKDDKDACNKGNACSSLGTDNFPPANACGDICNYARSSANVSPN